MLKYPSVFLNITDISQSINLNLNDNIEKDQLSLKNANLNIWNYIKWKISIQTSLVLQLVFIHPYFSIYIYFIDFYGCNNIVYYSISISTENISAVINPFYVFYKSIRQNPFQCKNNRFPDKNKKKNVGEIIYLLPFRELNKMNYTCYKNTEKRSSPIWWFRNFKTI